MAGREGRLVQPPLQPPARLPGRAALGPRPRPCLRPCLCPPHLARRHRLTSRSSISRHLRRPRTAAAARPARPPARLGTAGLVPAGHGYAGSAPWPTLRTPHAVRRVTRGGMPPWRPGRGWGEGRVWWVVGLHQPTGPPVAGREGGCGGGGVGWLAGLELCVSLIYLWACNGGCTGRPAAPASPLSPSARAPRARVGNCQWPCPPWPPPTWPQLRPLARQPATPLSARAAGTVRGGLVGAGAPMLAAVMRRGGAAWPPARPGTNSYALIHPSNPQMRRLTTLPPPRAPPGTPHPVPIGRLRCCGRVTR